MAIIIASPDPATNAKDTAKEDSTDDAAKQAEQAKTTEDAKKAEGAKTIADKQRPYLSELFAHLKDPESARTQNLRFVYGKGGEALCGEVNAKNSFGGYVGFRPFVVTERVMDRQTSRVFTVSYDSNDSLIEAANEVRINAAGCQIPSVVLESALGKR